MRPDDRYKFARDVARVIEQFVEPEVVETQEETDLNSDFLQWVRSAEGHATTGLSTASVSPQATDFLRWLEDEYGSTRCR